MVNWKSNSTLKKEAISSSETLVSTYRSTRRYSTEDQYQQVDLLNMLMHSGPLNTGIKGSNPTRGMNCARVFLCCVVLSV
jgi:hypothetical protein